MYVLGVAVAIGAASHKVLGVKPKNKRCSVWQKGHDSTDHPCARNHVGSSGSMEADGIVQMFNEAPEKHDMYYTEYIADGDSSTADAILRRVSY